MYNKPQGTLPEADISSVALRTSAVKSSRCYRPSLRAFPEAESTSNSIRNFEDFDSEVFKAWVCGSSHCQAMSLAGCTGDGVSSGPQRFRWGPYMWFVWLLFSAHTPLCNLYVKGCQLHRTMGSTLGMKKV
ncbi:hypothetical protein BY996DRAFT_6422707 [Phakopsora pachyrhizi]|nr:hypothetical protein BY996DRAFT_6422707 [Phakopsora pachyrhizi]